MSSGFGARRHVTPTRKMALIVTAVIAATVLPAGTTIAVTPAGFSDNVVFSGLTQPTAVRFASDGRVFVAEKSGLIKVFDNLTDTTPTVFADLRTQVHNFWDRGLLGMELHPAFPSTPYVYVLYTHDAAIGGTAPRWGTVGATSDGCPTPPGPTTDGCVVSGRLSRLQASGNTMTGPETVLIEDWCQQYPSHSIGSLKFGPDGMLYASGGDGASFNFADWGQDGSPLNPCGDPPSGVGGTQTPPTAEGGALRSQDVRSLTSDPVGLDGTVIRIDPLTGAGLSTNPLGGNADPNARRIVATGFRNPFRFTFRPRTSELWIGDVGWNTWEEIDRLTTPVDSTLDNMGWPCFEGAGRQSGYDGANLNLCENFYAAGGATSPYYTYNHSALVVPGESCPTGSSSIAGLAFYNGGNYPSAYTDALFFADYSRDCIWVMRAGTNGLPDASRLATFVSGAANPVALEIGPGGDLFYADFDGGAIHRIVYTAANQPPNAVIQANPTSGSAPLTVTFNASGSTDPNAGDTLSYAWDLDNDGAFDDGNTVQVQATYSAGSHPVTLRVTDQLGASDIDAVTINATGNPPVPVIDGPSASTTWAVGDVIPFSGHATDTEDGTIPANRLTWSLILHHCPSNCHTHTIQDFAGVSSGSFTAPDHDYPSFLELKLTATDTSGQSASTSVQLDPKTVQLTFQTNPTGLQLSVGSSSGTAPFNRTVIVGSKNSISAPSPQNLSGRQYAFGSWSDGGQQTHEIVAPSSNATYTATFADQGPVPTYAQLVAGLSPVAYWRLGETGGTTAADAAGGNTGTYVGSPGLGTAGLLTGDADRAVTFDGSNDAVTVPSSASLNQTSRLSIVAWIQPAKWGAKRRIVEKGTSDNQYKLTGENGQLTWQIAGVGKTTAPLPSTGARHLVVATFDGTSPAMRLYVDGVQVASSVAVGTAIPATTNALNIGNQPGSNNVNDHFRGVIDDVSIHSITLSASQVTSLWQNGITGP
jgi:glucose/arabinose dehydrogenase/PKD repeat protein